MILTSNIIFLFNLLFYLFLLFIIINRIGSVIVKLKNKKSLFAIIAVFVVVLVGVTIAYLQSTDTFENVFNAGNIKLKLLRHSKVLLIGHLEMKLLKL